MKILILSFYFPPDLSAGSFRAESLVKALRSAGDSSLHIDVLTTMPNRYNSMQNAALEVENELNLSIHRIKIPPHKSGMLDQSKSFFTFAQSVLKKTKGREWDIIVATSSRLMTASLGAYLATRINAPLYLDIRDLFTDTMSDILKNSPMRILLPGIRFLEKRTFFKAARINLVSAGFLPHARAVAPQHKYRIFTNGIDDEFLKLNFSKQTTTSLPLIVYAGNIGEGQGLHLVLPKAAKALEGKVQFRLIGDGGRRTQLEGALKAAKVTNVEILNPVPRNKLFNHYKEADILFLHLNDYTAFHKVLPSKIFEYAATGKPLLAGVAGYAAKFLNKEVEGVQVFTPCDAIEMTKSIDKLLFNKQDFKREKFCNDFARTNIMQKMALDILSIK